MLSFLFSLLVPLLVPLLAAALPAGNSVVFPSTGDWWVIGAENTLVFNWTGKGGEPTTTLYNVDRELMAAPFFWESAFVVNHGRNVVRSSAALVGAAPGEGYYIGIDINGKHLTSHTFEIRAGGSALPSNPEALSAATTSLRSAAAPRAATAPPLGAPAVAVALVIASCALGWDLAPA